MKLILKKISLFIATAFCMSCNEFRQSIQETLHPDTNTEEVMETNGEHQDVPVSSEKNPVAAKPEKDKPLLTADKKALQAAEHRLRQLPKFQDKPIMVFRAAHFYNDGRIILSIQDPVSPEFIDEYTYKDGEWLVPKPVRITMSDRVEERLVSLDDVPFTTANTVYEVIRQKFQEIENDEPVPTIYFVIFDGRPRWYPSSLQTDRSSYTIEFNTDGSLRSFKKD